MTIIRLKRSARQQIISRAIDNSGPIPSRGALSQLYPANSTASLCAPSHVYHFTHCSDTLNISGKRVLKGKNGSWDLSLLEAGKWDFVHWDWDSRSKHNRKMGRGRGDNSTLSRHHCPCGLVVPWISKVL